MASPGLPPSLKKIQPYITLSKQFENRNPVVAYHVKMYAIQEGMSEVKRDPAAKLYLLNLMDSVETMKLELKNDPSLAEGVSNNVVAQAHVESVGLKMFKLADEKDRQGIFDKTLSKSFYLASYLLTCLNQFGEVDEQIQKLTKYAKWKAVEIDRCLKAGITPTPGPPVQEEEEYEGDNFGGPPMPQPSYGGGAPSDPGPSSSSYYPPQPPSNQDRPVPVPRTNIPHSSMPGPGSTFSEPTPNMSSYPPLPVAPSSMPSDSTPYPPYPNSGSGGSGSGSFTSIPSPAPSGGSSSSGSAAVKLGPEEMTQAQKYCKFASSALDYDDTPGAIKFLNKALKLLQTGKDD